MADARGKGTLKPTMMDVARRAGVSQSTVSAVLNGHSRRIRISEETEARVRTAMSELGFRPNLAARGLRLQSTKTIGFVTDFIASGPFAGRMVLGAQEEAWKDGHMLLVVNTDGDASVAESGVQALVDRRVDGLLFAAMAWGPVTLPSGMTSVPSVLVNCWEGDDADLLRLATGGEPESSHAAVWPSEVDGGRLATEAVVKAGHRDIAFVGRPNDAAGMQREFGFRHVLAAAGIPVREEWIDHSDNKDISDGYTAGARLIAAQARPTAVVCYNDRVAVGVMTALLAAGVRVPLDMSVVGYDDDEELASHFPPGITTVALPHYELGQAGIQTLLGSQGNRSRAAVRRVQGHLVTRGTVGPPPPNSAHS